MAEVMRTRFMFCYIRSENWTSPHTRGRAGTQKGWRMPFSIRNYVISTMGSALILTGLMSWANAQNRPIMVPADSVIPAGTLDNLPHKDISNGIVSAKVYL